MTARSETVTIRYAGIPFAVTVTAHRVADDRVRIAGAGGARSFAIEIQNDDLMKLATMLEDAGGFERY